jgi:hypothetical protein
VVVAALRVRRTARCRRFLRRFAARKARSEARNEEQFMRLVHTYWIVCPMKKLTSNGWNGTPVTNSQAITIWEGDLEIARI